MKVQESFSFLSLGWTSFALKPSSVKKVTEMKGRGQETSMQISSGAEVPEISLRQCCSHLFLPLAGI